VGLCALTAAAQSEQADFFESRIRPLLARQCLSCHGGQKLSPLDMLGRDELLKGGKHGPAIVPGKPDESLLIKAVTHTHERLKMPLNGKLSDQEIADLKSWIAGGAVWPESAKIAPQPASKYAITAEQRAFWSFQPVRKTAPPSVRNKRWPRSPIDAFLLAKIEEAGLSPAPPADRRTLIRRATLDLTGLPPTPDEVDTFLADRSPDAFAKVVDRLLASPRYGERWGRYWLDVARYSDDKLDSTGEVPHPNAWRYRDWVIQAFNDDMPYDVFVKAQIAGDLMPDSDRYVAGLGFHALRPEQQDDRVDATTRGFLGLTVACAQCHHHKFDPIPTEDYYALLGVFDSSSYQELPIAPKDVVERWESQKKAVDEQDKALKDFLAEQAASLARVLAAQTADYLMASLKPQTGHALDQETFALWRDYLKSARREHPYLKEWEKLAAENAPEEKLRAAAAAFQKAVLAVEQEKRDIDEKNLIRLGGSNERRDLANADLLSLSRDNYFLWRDLFSPERGLFYKRDQRVERFLTGEWKAHATRLRAELERLKAALPEKYPYLHVIRDAASPRDARLLIRGERGNPGDVVPRRFVSILCEGEPRRFSKGSGRLELAEAIADPTNPLTARVIANRIWRHRFGQGIVRTTGNFGELGERPSHPELLDYLAARLVESRWSLKALHREMMLTSAYQMSAAASPKGETVDPDNRLLWRFPRQRLDVEALRDSMLAASGELDGKVGGPPMRLSEPKNLRRTVYGFVSRKKLDPLLAVFDFPNPNTMSEQRIVTNVPVQRLFFLNSPFAAARAEALAKRLKGAADRDKIRHAYRILFAREPSPAELALGAEYVARGEGAWTEYAQVLFSSNEFLFVD
jgi:mono/diheme cytochrome c family protein